LRRSWAGGPGALSAALKARLALRARIHSQQGIGEAAWELVYFGRHPNARPRLYFDPASGRVEERAAV
jgi:hypothetical protein